MRRRRCSREAAPSPDSVRPRRPIWATACSISEAISPRRSDPAGRRASDPCRALRRHLARRAGVLGQRRPGAGRHGRRSLAGAGWPPPQVRRDRRRVPRGGAAAGVIALSRYLSPPFAALLRLVSKALILRATCSLSFGFVWWSRADSNRRPLECHSESPA